MLAESLNIFQINTIFSIYLKLYTHCQEVVGIGT